MYVFLCAVCSYAASPGWGVRCGCVLGFLFALRPASPGWGAEVCVLVCAYRLQSAFLAGVCGLWVGSCLAPCPVPLFLACRARFPGFAAPGAGCSLAPVRVPWLWPAAALCGMPCGPAWCAVPRLVEGSLGALVGFPVPVVPSPTRGFHPGSTGRLCGQRQGRPETRLMVPAAGPLQDRGAGLAPRRTGSGPRNQVVPGGSLRLRSWAACAAVVWRVWTRSLRRPASSIVRRSTGASAGAPGLFRVHANTPFSGSEDTEPGSPACVRVHALLGRLGRAGRAGILVHITFSVAVVLARFVSLAPSGLGFRSFFCFLLSFLVLFSFLSPPLCLAFSLSFASGPGVFASPLLFCVFPFFFSFVPLLPPCAFYYRLSFSLLLCRVAASCPPLPTPRCFVVVTFLPPLVFSACCLPLFWAGEGAAP